MAIGSPLPPLVLLRAEVVIGQAASWPTAIAIGGDGHGLLALLTRLLALLTRLLVIVFLPAVAAVALLVISSLLVLVVIVVRAVVGVLVSPLLGVVSSA